MGAVTTDAVVREDLVGQARDELAALLELVLDQGVPAMGLRRQGRLGWQVLLGDPEGPLSEMSKYGVMAESVADALFRETVDGLNVLDINGVTYRFARVEFRISETPAIIFVPG